MQSFVPVFHRGWPIGMPMPFDSAKEAGGLS